MVELAMLLVLLINFLFGTHLGVNWYNKWAKAKHDAKKCCGRHAHDLIDKDEPSD